MSGDIMSIVGMEFSGGEIMLDCITYNNGWGKEGNVYVVEQVEISSDSDTEELLEDIADLDDLQNSLKNIAHLDGLMRSTLRKTITPGEVEDESQAYQPRHVKRL